MKNTGPFALCGLLMIAGAAILTGVCLSDDECLSVVSVGNSTDIDLWGARAEPSGNLAWEFFIGVPENKLWTTYGYFSLDLNPNGTVYLRMCPCTGTVASGSGVITGTFGVANGITNIKRKGGGCDRYNSLFDFGLQVWDPDCEGFKLTSVGNLAYHSLYIFNSPDFYTTTGHFYDVDNLPTICVSGLSDAVNHTPAMKTGHFDECSDVYQDLIVNLSDITEVGPYLLNGASCNVDSSVY